MFSGIAAVLNNAAARPVLFGTLLVIVLGAVVLQKGSDQAQTSQPVPKAPVTIASALAELGLSGTFAMDCTRRPSPTNMYRRFGQGGSFSMMVVDGPPNSVSGAPSERFVIMQVKKISDGQVDLSLGRQPGSIVIGSIALQVEHNRIRSWSSEWINGRMLPVRQTTPWLMRC